MNNFDALLATLVTALLFGVEVQAQYLLEPLPPQTLYFGGRSSLSWNVSAGGYASDVDSNDVQELSMIFSTTQANALLYYFADSLFAVSLSATRGGLVVSARDEAANESWSLQVNCSMRYNRSLVDGMPLQLEVTVKEQQIVFFVGNQRCGALRLGGATRLIGDGFLQLGLPPDSTSTVVDQSVGALIGSVYMVRIRRNGEELLELVRAVIDQQDVDGLQTQNLQVEASQLEDDLSEEERLLDAQNLYAVTFFGELTSFTRIPDRRGEARYWDWNIEPGTSASIELQLLTYDPINLLVFKGSLIASYAYMCLEMFDGRLYFRYNFGQRRGDRSLEMCNRRRVNDGKLHDVRLEVTRDSAELLSVYASCDGLVVAQEAQTYGDSLDGYLYIAGVDSFERLPWYIWSRRHYNGAFSYFRVNGISFEFHKVFPHKRRDRDTPAIASRVDVPDRCNPPDLPRGAVCRQSEGGKCWVDRESISSRRGYLCDCSSLSLDAIKCGHDYYESAFGSNEKFWAMQISPTWVTHADDIIISFYLGNATLMQNIDHGLHDASRRKRRQAVGPGDRYLRAATGPTLFGITNERHDKFMILRRSKSFNGLELEILLEDDVASVAQPVVVPIRLVHEEFNKWCTLRMHRRANYMRFDVDDNPPFELKLPGEGFEMETAHIHAGCLPDQFSDDFLCNNATVFDGEIRNFVVNRLDVLSMLHKKTESWGLTGHLISVYRAVQLVATIVRKRIYLTPQQAEAEANEDLLGGSYAEFNETDRSRFNQSFVTRSSAVGGATAVGPTRQPMLSQIGLLGRRDSLIELPASNYLRDDDDAVMVSFQFTTELSDCLIFYLRGRQNEEGEDSSFVVLELVRRKVRVNAQIIGEFFTEDSDFASQHTLQFKYVFDAVNVAPGETKTVTITLQKDSFTINVDGNFESWYFVADQKSAVELTLSRLPLDLFTGTIFLGGMPYEFWSQDLSRGRLTNTYRYMRGCITSLSIRTTLITYSLVLAVHASIAADWQIQPTCESLGRLSCADLYCAPYMACVQPANTNAYCSCAGTAFRGDDCDQMPEFGYYCGQSGIQAGVYSLFPYAKPQSTQSDDIAVGVLTRYSEGTLFKLENLQSDVLYLEVRLKAGRVYIDYRNARRGQNATLSFPETVRVNNATYTVVRLKRSGDFLNASVYSRDGYFEMGPVQLLGLQMFGSGRFRVNMCGRLSASISNYFTGVLSGFSWNSVNLFEFGRSNGAKKRELRGDVIEVHTPYQLSPWPCYGLFALQAGEVCAAPTPSAPAVSKTSRKAALSVVVSVDGSGVELDVYADKLDVGAVAALTADSPLGTSAIITMAVISGLLMLAAAVASLIFGGLGGSAAPPGAAAPPAAAAAAAGDPDIGVAGGNNVRSAPPPPPPSGDDIPTGNGPNVRSAPPVPGPVAAVADHALVHAAAMPLVCTVPYPVPYPVPYAVPMPMPMPYAMMPVSYPYLNGQQVLAVQQTKVPAITHNSQHHTSRLRISELPSESTLDVRKKGATMQRADEMRFGGTETISEKTTLLDRAPSQTLRSTMNASASASASASMPGLIEFGDEFKVSCFVLTNDNQHVITGSSTGAPSFWSLGSGEMLRMFEDAGEDDYYVCAHELHLACGDSLLIGEVSVDQSLVNSQIALNAPSHFRKLQIWRTVDGSVVPTPCLLYCTSSCLMNNKQVLVAGAVDSSNKLNICLWNLVQNEPQAQVEIAVGSSSTNADLQVRALKMSLDDSCCVAALTADADAGETSFFVVQMRGPERQAAKCATFDCSYDCFAPVAGLRCVVGTRHGELLIWSVQTASVIAQFQINSALIVHACAISCVAASRNCEYLASGDGLGNVKLWRFNEDFVAPDYVNSLNGHRDRVCCFAFTHDNEFLLTGSLDGSIRLWKTADAVQTSWFTSNMNILRVQMTDNKSAIVALGEKDQRRKFMMFRIVRSVVTRKQVTEEPIVD